MVIAAGEGLRNPDRSFVSLNEDSLNLDAFGHPEPGGVGQFLADLIMKELKLKARVDKPGTMQRNSGMGISEVDEEEAFRVGKTAVTEAVSGKSGYMIALERQPGEPYHCMTRLVPLNQIANREKSLLDTFICNTGNHVTGQYLNYARPLIGGALPDYVTLQGHRIARKLPEQV